MIFDGSTGGRWIAWSAGTLCPSSATSSLAFSDDLGGYAVEQDPSVFRHPAPRYPGDECDHVGKCP